MRLTFFILILHIHAINWIAFRKESSLYLPNDICSDWHMKSEQNTKQSLSCLVEKYNLASNKRKCDDKIWTWHTKYGTTQTVRTNLSAKSLLLLCWAIFIFVIFQISWKSGYTILLLVQRYLFLPVLNGKQSFFSYSWRTLVGFMFHPTMNRLKFHVTILGALGKRQLL